MPQMAPLSWLMLMIMFIITIMIINSMMYFNKNYTNNASKMKSHKNLMNWKW
uniref:ATP synthase complex subunit 8 n=1 Tax=Esakia hungerfordi TaxID=3095925 RepID=A0AB38Z6V8_9HEMI|nr:ATP synthase F0 subunit 8 [Esakia hungerfordi]WPW46856.1 ATP synthase F0 subunit 8 [Esakia hungerfordi]